MPRIESLNGQKAIIDAVLARRDSQKKEIIIVTGLPGVGVTWALQHASEAWDASGGVALNATGEPLAIDRKLFPWLTLVLPGAKRLARLAVLKTGVAQGSRAIPLVGSVTSYIVEELLNYRKRRLAREALLIGEQEQDILFIVQSTAGRRHLLLTIDRIEAWDDASSNLLGLLLSGRLDEFYPALSNVLVLIGAGKDLPQRFRSLCSELPILELPIRPLERAEMPIALTAFNLGIGQGNQLDRLYEMTDGRLDLLHDLATHLRDRQLGSPPNLDEFYTKMIERRIQSIGPETHVLEEVLAGAAVLGQVFTMEDVQCLTGYPMERIEANLRFALTEHFVKIIGQTAHFQSSALHDYFHKEYSTDHVRYHGRFAECLRIMRPGEYSYRLRHLLLGGRAEDALICYALAALASYRANHMEPVPGSLKDTAGWKEIAAYLEVMYRAQDLFVARQLQQGLEALDSVEGFLPDQLIAERDCLEAQMLLDSHRMTDFVRAETILERWDNLRSQESELWARIGHVLLVAHVQTNQIEKARALEKRLTAEYWARRRVDPQALHGLNVLRRRAECIHQLPTATLRLESAVSFFGPHDAGPLPRHPRDYYYALNNLVGNLLASGRFAEGYERAVELEALVRAHPGMGWPILEIPASNLILASYLTNRLQPAEAAEMMEKVVGHQDGTGDRILMENNLGVYLARAERQPEALNLLEGIYSRINSDGEPDGYHRYFVANNVAALRAINGEASRAMEMHKESEQLLDSFYPAIRETLLRRHKLIESAIREAHTQGIIGFDTFLATRHDPQLGPQWSFYGRGFLLTDIQFWTQE